MCFRIQGRTRKINMLELTNWTDNSVLIVSVRSDRSALLLSYHWALATLLHKFSETNVLRQKPDPSRADQWMEVTTVVIIWEVDNDVTRNTFHPFLLLLPLHLYFLLRTAIVLIQSMQYVPSLYSSFSSLSSLFFILIHSHLSLFSIVHRLDFVHPLIYHFLSPV